MPASPLQKDSMVEYGFRRVIVVIIAISAALLEIIDSTVVNVSLNDMKGNLGATLSEIGWVITSYAIGNVIVIPLTSWLSIQFGRRNYFAASIIMFTVCSFFCGNSHTLMELIVFRLLQGMAGGALLVTSQTIITESFPKEKAGMAQAIYGMGVIIGPAIGPPLGGYITENYSWPYIFYVNIPVGIIATLLTLNFLRNPKYGERTPAREVDWYGIVFLAVAVSCLQYILEKGQEEDWFSSKLIITAAVTSAVMGYLFFWREWVAKKPIVNLRVLKDNNLKIGVTLMFILGFGLYASSLIIPMYLQNILGWSPFQAGFLMLPGTVISGCMMPLIGTLIQRGVKQQILIATGFTLFFIYSMWGYKILTPFTGWDNFFWMVCLRGFGMSMMMVPITTMAFANLHGKSIGEGTAFTGMARQMGGSFGIAIVTTFISRRVEKYSTNLVGYLTPNNVIYQQRYNGAVAMFMQHGYAPNQARQAAYESIFGQVAQQATIMSYMDVFLYVGVMFMICVPFLLMVKSSKAKKEKQKLATAE